MGTFSFLLHGYLLSYTGTYFLPPPDHIPLPHQLYPKSDPLTSSTSLATVALGTGTHPGGNTATPVPAGGRTHGRLTPRPRVPRWTRAPLYTRTFPAVQTSRRAQGYR
ncbi:hypothetical protein Pmani_005439 [Petrolisthes manimaculis]|uniref:Uncharacterized protein n=1 Tax=Petrolisthes manimaculis TaxID=1843537 RepID=A0AAE1UM69_9EUCA|nr:hypothetical protein Pmani_005439 [Petrolisthes manimaculis]